MRAGGRSPRDELFSLLACIRDFERDPLPRDIARRLSRLPIDEIMLVLLARRRGVPALPIPVFIDEDDR